MRRRRHVGGRDRAALISLWPRLRSKVVVHPTPLEIQKFGARSLPGNPKSAHTAEMLCGFYP